VTEAGQAAIVITGLRKRFAANEVLRGIDLNLPAGQTTAIIGPSGSGKSTLVRCLNHLEPIQSGEIRIGKYRITPAGVEREALRLSPREVARFRAGIGMVFQSFNLFPHLTVLENIIEAPMGVLSRDRRTVMEEGMELLRQVNLAEKRDSYPAFLSGGQQQRVAIVRSLMMHPSIMLFDEPTSALDPELTGEVLKVIRELAIRGRTSVIVTHELAFAREVASKVVFMDQGLVAEEGPPEHVLANPKTERALAFIRRSM
jgi:polar amino acid transport system ATP-binding protein